MKTKEEIQKKADEIWDSMNDNERYGVKFGLFPVGKMQPLRGEGFTPDNEHGVVVALMKKGAHH